MKDVLAELIKIYEPHDVDWMGFRLTKNNPYTYHHIKEESKGGKLTLNNGAILTERAHRLLNLLEKECPKAYRDYQNLFKYINSLKRPIDDFWEEEINGMLADLLYHKIYHFRHDIDLSKYMEGSVKPKCKQKYVNKR